MPEWRSEARQTAVGVSLPAGQPAASGGDVILISENPGAEYFEELILTD